MAGIYDFTAASLAGEDVEIIVFDNHSTDGSPEFLGRGAIRSVENLGFAGVS